MDNLLIYNEEYNCEWDRKVCRGRFLFSVKLE